MSESPAVQQLQKLVCQLGGIVLIVSLSLTGLLWKQTQTVATVAAAQREQLTQMQANVQRLGALANALAAISRDQPEWLAIFRAHGIDVKAGN